MATTAEHEQHDAEQDAKIFQHNAVLKHLWGQNLELMDRLDRLEQVLAGLGFICLDAHDDDGDL